MSYVTFETALRLKEAGFPQQEPTFGQIRYESGEKIVIISSPDKDGGFAQVYPDCHTIFDEWSQGSIFAPDVEDITALLPSVFTLEMREGRHSCEIDTWQNLIQTQADNFAEAAALAWLALNTPQ